MLRTTEPVFCSHQCPLVGVSARMKSRLGETSCTWGTTVRAARLPPEATGVAPTIALFLLGGTSPRGLRAPFPAASVQARVALDPLVAAIGVDEQQAA